MTDRPLIPDWNEPVATGTRSPILSDAFWPFRDRICGFWMILVLLSVNKAVALALDIVAAKSVAFRLASEFKLMPVPELLLLVDVLELLLELVLILACNWTEALVGALIPRVCVLSRLTSINAKSTTTSGEALSKSLTIFSARSTWSGVPRITMASCEASC